jgi:hypothetical protein
MRDKPSAEIPLEQFLVARIFLILAEKLDRRWNIELLKDLVINESSAVPKSLFP